MREELLHYHALVGDQGAVEWPETVQDVVLKTSKDLGGEDIKRCSDWAVNRQESAAGGVV